jgi:DNA-binding MarR family transcriptional regulator
MAKDRSASNVVEKASMELASRKKKDETAAPADTPPGVVLQPEAEPMFDLIELLFFAYRDFVGDADRLLENYGFGRAHHRVLHFVSRRPGLTIAELLDILKITKQSLNRVLKELRDKGFVEVRAGVIDRRHRQLYPTKTGVNLALNVAKLQSQRFRRVFAHLQKSARPDAIAFLLAMIDPREQEKVATLVASGARLKPLSRDA